MSKHVEIINLIKNIYVFLSKWKKYFDQKPKKMKATVLIN